ncbi:MAG TPA: DUF2231 domain-containing protein [Gemmatimonadales bacterium]
MFGYDWPRLHAALNDLPTALLVTAVLFDLLATITRRTVFRQVGFWTLMVGAVGGAAAVISGLQAEEHIDHGEAVHQLMGTHEDLALITLGVFAVLALWRILREKRMASTERGVVVALSVVGLGFVVATGVYGGKLVFEHAAGIPSPVLETELHERTEGHHHDAAETSTSQDSAAQQPAPGHVDSPGTRPHTHTHAPGTPPHQD